MADNISPFDDYSFRARVLPALAVVVIPATGFLCWLPAFSVTQLALVAVLSLVLGGLFAQFGRDRGKAIEPTLFAQWGGQPAVQLLRCASGLLNKDARERYRLKLNAIPSAPRIPIEFDELADPKEAERRYESVCLYLREATRNKAAFPVVFGENVNYGFRRNLLGMKPAGILLCLLGAAASVLAVLVGMKVDPIDVPAVPVVAAILNAAMLAWWWLRITSNWVRVAAFDYAARLLGSCDSMPMASPSKSMAAEALKE
jgi:hypothetical protein